MKPFRGPKTESILKRELNNILLRDFEFENTLVTITSVEVSSDLLQAKVRVSIIPEDRGAEVIITLEDKKRELQHRLLKKTRLRSIPRLKFEVETY
jgi:ribosome-binding factor A